MFRIFKTTNKLLIVLSLSVFLTLQTLPMAAKAAATGIYFDPTSVSAVQGSRINISIKANTASVVSVSELYISYDPSSLEYVSHSISGSPLSIQYTVEQSNGVLNLGTGAPGGQSAPAGDGLYLATLTFKLLKNSGTSQINLGSNSYLGYSGASVVQNGATTSVNFSGGTTTTAPSTAPAATPTPTPTSTASQKNSSSQSAKKQPSVIANPSVTPSPQTPATEAPSADITASKVSAITPLGFANEEIQIKVVSNEPTKSIVKYGRSANELRQAANSDSYQKSYFVPLGVISKTYKAGETLYYQVETVDEAGNKTTSEVKQLSTTPKKVSIFAKDKSGKAIEYSTLLINGRTFTTDEKGNVLLNGVLPGLIIVSLKSNNTNPDQYFGEFVLDNSDKMQTLEVTPTGIKKVSGSPIVLLSVVTLVTLFAAAAGMLLYRQLKQTRFATAAYGSSPIYGGNGLSPKPLHDQAKLPYHPETVVEPNKTSNSTSVSTEGKTLSQIEEEVHSNAFSKSHTVQPIKENKSPFKKED